VLVTDTAYPRLLVTMGGVDDFREPIELDAESFIGVKGYKAIGKRITTLHIAKVEELEPTRIASPDPSQGGEGAASPQPSIEDESPASEEEQVGVSQQDVADELNGQLRLEF